MKRSYTTNRLDSDRLDTLLDKLGFVYGADRHGEKRYSLSEFMARLVRAKVFTCDKGDEVILSIDLPHRG